MPSKRGYYQVLAFDGGSAASGWFHAVLDARVFMDPQARWEDGVEAWNTGEYEGSMNDMCAEAIERIHMARYGRMPYLGNVDVIGEDFDLTQRMGHQDDLLSSYYFNAVISYACDKKFSVPFHKVKRVLRVNITPDRLTAYGFDSPWYRGRWPKSGEGKDSFAACQNGVAFIRRRKLDANQKPWKESALDVGRFSYPLTPSSVRGTSTPK
jgi:hypothetical protein